LICDRHTQKSYPALDVADGRYGVELKAEIAHASVPTREKHPHLPGLFGTYLPERPGSYLFRAIFPANLPPAFHSPPTALLDFTDARPVK
jgi:hypothetical protein